MENLWIYVLLIFIFIVRAIAKSAQKQINANKKNIDQDEKYMPEEVAETVHPADRPLTWEDLFPSEPKQETLPVEKPEKKIKKNKTENIESVQSVAASKINTFANIEPAVPESEMNITDDVYNTSDRSDLLPYGTEELRKAVIASEILAKKF